MAGYGRRHRVYAGPTTPGSRGDGAEARVEVDLALTRRAGWEGGSGRVHTRTVPRHQETSRAVRG